MFKLLFNPKTKKAVRLPWTYELKKLVDIAQNYIVKARLKQFKHYYKSINLNDWTY